MDAFGATFWQCKERYLRINFPPIRSFEGVVFERQRERTTSGNVNILVPTTRITVDWLGGAFWILTNGPSPIAYRPIAGR